MSGGILGTVAAAHISDILTGIFQNFFFQIYSLSWGLDEYQQVTNRDYRVFFCYLTLSNLIFYWPNTLFVTR